MNEEKVYSYLKHSAPGKGKAIKSDALEQELGISGNELRPPTPHRCAHRQQ